MTPAVIGSLIGLVFVIIILSLMLDSTRKDVRSLRDRMDHINESIRYAEQASFKLARELQDHEQEMEQALTLVGVEKQTRSTMWVRKDS